VQPSRAEKARHQKQRNQQKLANPARRSHHRLFASYMRRYPSRRAGNHPCPIPHRLRRPIWPRFNRGI
jgi:hypothetical protein